MQNIDDKQPVLDDNKKSDSNFNKKKLEELYSEIEKYFSDTDAYKDPNFNGYKLALDLNTNLNTITKAISLKNGATLKNLTNYYRVKEVKQKIINREHNKYTLKHISNRRIFEPINI